MKFVDVRKYVTGLLSASFINKSILDNLAEDENENLTYKGAVIKGSGGKITSTFKIESTTLYNGATRDFPVTLSDSINNYDLIKITFGWQAPLNDGSYSLCEPIYQIPDKLKENTLFTFWDYYYIYFAITDKTFSSVQAELNVGCLYQIEGLKFVVDSVGGGASES
ncbi:MAG: hypothetical protein MSA15_07235, partial [Clostridium sp.]|nr:hypothetical protein [Clostridium sp.]